MKKGKRIVALICVVILVGIYLVTLLSAIFTSPATASLFKASLFCTVAVPVLLYGYMLIYKVLKRHNQDRNTPPAQNDKENKPNDGQDKKKK